MVSFTEIFIHFASPFFTGGDIDFGFGIQVDRRKS